MCGIAGILNINRESDDIITIKNMCDSISHRGMDDVGYVIINNSGNSLELTNNEFKYKNVRLSSIEDGFCGSWRLALGHRRLAIIDLTEKAHQPMSVNQRVWLTYNGEVYNYRELRNELEKLGYVFHSASDTEVILKSYLEWGIDCIKKFNGMFAFALWDSDRRKLFLVRDRFGIKPLYYVLKNGVLIFASEIKAILQSKINKKVQVDLQALNEYFTFQNVFTDRTLFKDIRILMPATYMEVSLDNDKSVEIHKYWDYKFSCDDINVSEIEIIEEIRRLFIQAVNRQLVGEVALGSYLSGGMDTGSIATLMRKQIGRISTFTCGFDLSSASGLELGYDERNYAEVLANHLKTEHYEVVLHAGDMEQVMPKLIWHLEDLRLGQSYPNYYVSRLAGKFVKVVLSGSGGDELFAGYPWRYYRCINARNRSDYLERYYNYWQRLISDKEKESCFQSNLYHEIKMDDAFNVFCSIFNDVDIVPQNNVDYINASLYFEAKTFLQGLLVVEDKISMAHSLETRVPFLDNDLVEFAMKIPPRYKLNNLDGIIRMDENEPGKFRKYYQMTSDGKNILRKSMQGIVSSDILSREKQGFSAPDASWFRGESIEYIKNLLCNPSARIYDYLKFEFVNRKIEEHIQGKLNNRLLIWSFLSFEWWLRQFVT